MNQGLEITDLRRVSWVPINKQINQVWKGNLSNQAKKQGAQSQSKRELWFSIQHINRVR